MEDIYGLSQIRHRSTGGDRRKSNIASAAHCATRLRLVIVDNGKVDKKDH